MARRFWPAASPIGVVVLGTAHSACGTLAGLGDYRVEAYRVEASSEPIAGDLPGAAGGLAGDAGVATSPSNESNQLNPLQAGEADDDACAAEPCGVQCLADSFAQGNACQLRAVQVAAGHFHTCVVLIDGSVRCFGDNSYGQLGDGSSSTYSFAPVSVLDLSGVRQIVAGRSHSCVLLTDGTAQCWGDNALGQLGVGVSGGRAPTPVPVYDLTGATALSSGQNHVCALLSNGSVQCWGDDLSDQLGTAPGTDNALPSLVTDLEGPALEVAAGGNDTCALLTTGQVQCWGDGLDIGLPSNALALRGGFSHHCALLESGGVQCWGPVVLGGAELGTGDAVDLGFVYRIVQVAGLSEVTSLATGTAHTCALSGGNPQCWGSNDLDELGNDTAGGASVVPTPVLGLSGAASLWSGADASHTCAILRDGSLRCWGWNSTGQLGREPSGDGATAGPVGAW